MVLFTEETLKLMPSTSLTSLSNALIVDKGSKETEIANSNSKIDKLQGTATLRAPVAGRVTVNSGGEESAQERQSSMSSPALAAANSASILNDSSTNPQGVPVFVPGTTDGTPTPVEIAAMANELTKYYESSQVEFSPITNTQISNLQQTRNDTQNSLDEINSALDSIQNIMDRRAKGELPDPKLNIEALSLTELPAEVQGIVDRAVSQNSRFVENKIVAPFIENQKILNTLLAQASGVGNLETTFDLEYGPPISSHNQFVLSQDGLYYDSRTKKVPQIVPYPLSSNMWSLQYDSNRGGRGVSFSETDGEDDVGTIFDLDMSFDEENPRVRQFLEYDDVLQQFEDDKQSQMTAVSGYISEILSNGYGASDALVQTYTAQLGAVGSVYSSKISKRRRQLEIAAIYGRDNFFVTDRTHPLGQGLFFKYIPPKGKAYEYKLQYADLPDDIKTKTFYTLEGGEQVMYDTSTNQVVTGANTENIIAVVGTWEQIPRIPINDFSYLQGSDIPYGLQRRITLFSEDLDTIIVPYEAKYVIAPASLPENVVENLAVDMIGYGDWVHRETSGSLSATTPLYKSLTDDIVSDDLLICYNFLDPDAITEPSGILYGLNNAAEGSTRLDGKLVGYSTPFVFPSGVGQAYFNGTLFDEQARRGPSWQDVKGSYVRLPNITRDYSQYSIPYNGVRPLDNLFYSKEGVTFDFWAYMPMLYRPGDSSGMGNYHRYKLVLANENSGPVPTNYVTANTQLVGSNTTGLRAGNTSTAAGGTDFSKTIGLIMGWRDRGSPNGTFGFATSGLEFVIAPTVGQNQPYTTDPTKSWGHSVCIAETWPDVQDGLKNPASGIPTEVGMFVPSSVRNVGGSGIADCSTAYCHFNIAFDYEKDAVNFHLNGQLLTTSSLTTVFGGKPGDTSLPTAVKMDLTNQTDTIVFNDPTKESFLGNSVYDERCTPERVAFPVFTPWIIGGGYTDTAPIIPGEDFRPQGFLGSNTNNTYQGTLPGDDLVTQKIPNTAVGSFFPRGQHQPPLSNGAHGTGSGRRAIPRSGLGGFLGSFKIYSKPLTTSEAKENYDAQKGFFNNILLPS